MISYNTIAVFHLLESILGKGALNSTSGESSFFCPNHPHHKKKLAVNIKKGNFHCWICDLKGRNVGNLIRRFGGESKVQEYYQLVGEPIKRVQEEDDFKLFNEEENLPELKEVSLPYGYRPFSETIYSDFPEYKHYMKYLMEERNLDFDTINFFKMGWSEIFYNRVIIPSYDCDNNLNYFVTRFIVPGDLKYLNCQIDKTKIIMFESLIDWTKEITLVEGPFDAIPHYKHNVIPVLGSSLSSEDALFKKISKENARVNVCMDNDREDIIEKALKMCQLFHGFGIECKFTDLSITGYKDPGMMPDKEFEELIRNYSVSYTDDLLLERLWSS
jgi:DNA primase